MPKVARLAKHHVCTGNLQWDAGAYGAIAAPAELNGVRLVDIGLGNGLQEMEIGETVDSSVVAGEPTRRSTCNFTVRI